ncbi:MAG: glycosyltransferase family 25 protein [Rhodobacteraceae bacterium]|nr:glycosyltransferase family 25 protein [Paracoccaceae bacterium]
MTALYYINLDRAPERRTFMEAQFADIGVQAQRFRALDARAAGPTGEGGYVPGSGWRYGLTKAEIACFESHRAVWRRVLEQGLSSAVIMEDDVVLSGATGPVIESLASAAPEYDLVKLDYSPKPSYFDAVRMMNGVAVRQILQPITSAGAYIVSGKGAKKLMKASRRYSDPADDFITMPRRMWRMYQVFPAVCIQVCLQMMQIEGKQAPAVSRSTVQPPDPDSPAQCRDKGPLWFRVRREFYTGCRKLYWLGARASLSRRGGFIGVVPCVEGLSARGGTDIDTDQAQ